MITRTKDLTFAGTYPLERIGNLKELLFFDIETTGFSGDSSTLYLIGCTYREDSGWKLIQWFCDTPDSEPLVLHSFFSFLKNYRVLIHFNGDGFDLPYLLKRCRAYHLPFHFDNIQSFDIYRKIRPLKKLLSMESLKQKAVEQFLGVSRKDLYSGGQLIQVYKDYLYTKEDCLYDLLILHNEDDLKGMPSILPILCYPDFLSGGFSFPHFEITGQKDLFGNIHESFSLVCESPLTVPVPFEFQDSFVRLKVRETSLILTVDLYEGTLKYFYPDYKNYYFLTYEDRAIHKSVAQYVDKDAKTRATAQNCYEKRKGRFLPLFCPDDGPCFKDGCRDKICYKLFDENMAQDSAFLQEYFTHLFTHLLPGLSSS